MILEEYPFVPPRAAFAPLSRCPYGFLLESASWSYGLGRWSLLGAFPFLILRVKGPRAWIWREEEGWREAAGHPLEVLGRLVAELSEEDASAGPPFRAGAVGYFGYDLRYLLEELPDWSLDDLRVPDCWLGFYDAAVLIDHARGRAALVSTGRPERGRLARTRARERARRLREALRGPAPARRPVRTGPLRSNFTREAYLEAVQRAKEYIAAGEIYQVNLSQRFHCELEGDAFSLYRVLARINPAPFAGYLNLGEAQLVSASPELFLRVRGRHVVTRPMKGTRPRGGTPEEDRRLRRELLRSEKDRAELVMIVDLLRNDLGRVCEFGSVRVRRLVNLEAYPTVFQTTATVEGRLREGCGPVELLRATFPGGSITGAPKIRAMEIIEELEPTKRAVYTGSLGFISLHGEMELNILIRSLLVKEGRAWFQVGGGIVADSDPAAEYQETLDKARALIAALQWVG